MATQTLVNAITAPLEKLVLRGHGEGKKPTLVLRHPAPLVSGGSLGEYESFKSTPAIGTEFPKAQLSDILKDEQKVRDLAVLTSERGVVFFRAQDLDLESQQLLCDKLGRLTGKPVESGLHIHPYTPPSSQYGDKILEVGGKLIGKPLAAHTSADPVLIHSNNIHSDVTYERYGSDYAILKLLDIPEEGGDTIWISGYGVYDRLSPPIRQLLERLTAQHDAKFFHVNAAKQGFSVKSDVARGHPENTGAELEATHPLIRTNPVTGWKSVYISHNFTTRINGVTKDESDLLLAYLFKLQAQNHDLSVRFRWEAGDVAVWDNRSTYHSATLDTVGARRGVRALAIGEAPYLQPDSKSRTEALGLRPTY